MFLKVIVWADVVERIIFNLIMVLINERDITRSVFMFMKSFLNPKQDPTKRPKKCRLIPGISISR